MVTGSHTVVHMKHNKVWSTLKDRPASHDELLQQCNKHLVYLGLGIFLQLKECILFNILGTITGQDPKTHKRLLASITQSIKHEVQEDYEKQRHSIKQHATAAAGSEAQLERVEKEMRSTTRIIGTLNNPVTSTRMKVTGPSVRSVKNIKKPMVNFLPFEVRLVRLSEKEILKYT